MSTKTKSVKLTDKQQEVVNLMADGFVLSHRQGTRFDRNWASLHKGTKSFKVAFGIGSQLMRKGVAVVDKAASDWKSTVFVLNERGKALAAATMSKKKTVTWYSVGRNGTAVFEQEFVGETDSYLVREGGRREAKSSYWVEWFKTRKQAIEFIRARLVRDVERAESALATANRELEEFNRNEPAT